MVKGDPETGEAHGQLGLNTGVVLSPLQVCLTAGTWERRGRIIHSATRSYSPKGQ